MPANYLRPYTGGTTDLQVGFAGIPFPGVTVLLEVPMTKNILSNQKGEIHRFHVAIPHAKVGKLYSTITGIKDRVRKIEDQTVYYIYLGPDSMFRRASIPTFAARFPVKEGR